MSPYPRHLGFALMVALAGCGDGATKTADSAVSSPDSGVAVQNDGPVATPDLSALADASKPDAAADLPAQDLAPPDLRTADMTLASDQAASEAQAADKPGVDGALPDGAHADAPTADKPTGDAGCEGWTTLKRISPAEASALIATSDPIVINVHYPYEGDIPGNDATIPYDDVNAIEAYLKHDHCADVLLVCKSGGMSQSAGNELVKRGYLRIQELKGGMMAWETAGYPLLKDGGS